MGLHCDRWIQNMAIQHRMIVPFVSKQVRNNVISYGLSSCGYDARLSDKEALFIYDWCNWRGKSEIDPKNIDDRVYSDLQPEPDIDTDAEYFTIPPHTTMLGRTVEYFKIPRNVLVICLGKSTYARAGLIVNVSPLEPGWEGYVTLELVNTTPLPLRVYANEGIAQFIFLTADESPTVSYADRNGKYQNQQAIVLPKV